MVTAGCRACRPLRIRVSMSAIGSVSISSCLPSPTGLRHTGYFTAQGQFPEADSAQPKLPNEGTRPAAHLAAAVLLHFEAGRPLRFDDHGLLRHGFAPLASLERHPEQLEEPSGFLVSSRGRDDGYFQT